MQKKHRKIFYKKVEDKFTIVAMSDGEISLELPYVETEILYHSFNNLEIVEENGELKVISK